VVFDETVPNPTDNNVADGLRSIRIMAAIC